MGREDEIEVRERAIRNMVEERIQAAMEAGAFENLPGKGRPLRLDENPYVPAELRLAYKVLADANFAPDWIELDKKLRVARDEIDALQKRHVAWLKRQAIGSSATTLRSSPSDPQAPAQELPPPRPSNAVLARHRRTRDELVKRVDEVNRQIDELNLIVPQLSLQRPRLSVEEVLSDFDEGCRKAYPGLQP